MQRRKGNENLNKAQWKNLLCQDVLMKNLNEVWLQVSKVEPQSLRLSPFPIWLEDIRFIAFTKKFRILRNWILYANNRKSKQFHKFRKSTYLKVQSLITKSSAILDSYNDLYNFSITCGVMTRKLGIFSLTAG